MQLTASPKGGEGIPVEAVTNIAMVAGNEKLFQKIIDGDEVKEWVGIGWISLGKADTFSLLFLPFIKRGK